MDKRHNRVWIFGMIFLADILFSWERFYIGWNAWVSIPKFLLPQYIVQKIMYGW